MSGQPYQRQDLTATRELKNGDETPTAPKTYFTEDDWAALSGRVKKVESGKQRVSKSRIEPSVKMASNQDKTTILLADIQGIIERSSSPTDSIECSDEFFLYSLIFSPPELQSFIKSFANSPD